MNDKVAQPKKNHRGHIESVEHILCHDGKRRRAIGMTRSNGRCEIFKIRIMKDKKIVYVRGRVKYINNDWQFTPLCHDEDEQRTNDNSIHN